MRRMVSDAGRADVVISSAGTNAWDGSPPSDGALLVGLERGIDLSGHRSRHLTRGIVDDNDLILVMEPSHLSAVKDLSPKASAHLLTGFTSGLERSEGVLDPFGGELTAYRETVDELERELSGLLQRIPAP